MQRIIDFVLHIWREMTGYYDRPIPYVIVRDWREGDSEDENESSQ